VVKGKMWGRGGKKVSKSVGGRRGEGEGWEGGGR